MPAFFFEDDLEFKNLINFDSSSSQNDYIEQEILSSGAQGLLFGPLRNHIRCHESNQDHPVHADCALGFGSSHDTHLVRSALFCTRHVLQSQLASILSSPRLTPEDSEMGTVLQLETGSGLSAVVVVWPSKGKMGRAGCSDSFSDRWFRLKVKGNLEELLSLVGSELMKENVGSLLPGFASNIREVEATDFCFFFSVHPPTNLVTGGTGAATPNMVFGTAFGVFQVKGAGEMLLVPRVAKVQSFLLAGVEVRFPVPNVKPVDED